MSADYWNLDECWKHTITNLVDDFFENNPGTTLSTMDASAPEFQKYRKRNKELDFYNNMRIKENDRPYIEFSFKKVLLAVTLIGVSLAIKAQYSKARHG